MLSLGSILVLSALLTATPAPPQPAIASTLSLVGATGATELPALRTAYSRTYDLHNGQYLAELFAVPVNEQGPGGLWFPVDSDTTDSVFPQMTDWWTGHVQKQNTVGEVKQNNDIYFRGGGAASHDKRQAWIKFDLSGIPDSGQVNATGLVYYCYSVDANGGPTTLVTVVNIDPVPATATQLWNAITLGDSASQRASHGTGWVLRPLTSVGVQTVRNSLSRDWVCFGIYEPENDNSRWGHAYGYYPRSTAPRMYVTFTPPPPPPDVGVNAIVAPTGALDTGAMVVPRATWHNYHSSAYGFSAWMMLTNPSNQRVYSELASIAALPAGAETTITFTGYNVGTASGTWYAKCSTFAFADTNWRNDTLQRSFTVFPRHADIGVASIVRPAGTVDTGVTVIPRAIFHNFHATDPASFEAWFVLTDPDAQRQYSHSVVIAGLPAGADTAINFPSYYFGQGIGQWIARCSIYCNIDTFPSNDIRQSVFTVTPWTVHSDIGVVQITAPTGCVDTSAPAQPAATWKNYLTEATGFEAYMMVRSPGGELVYNNSTIVSSLAAGAETTLVFPLFYTDTTQGQWVVRCSTYLTFDVDNSNDTMNSSFFVYVGGQVPAQPGWSEMEPMPVEPSGKNVKHGGWLTWMESDGNLYAGKGNKTADFYSYDPVGNRWQRRAQIPGGLSGKLPAKGAYGVADGERYVYFTKGNNTAEFWRYDVAGDSWSQLQDVPLGPSNKRVKGGNDMVFVHGANDTGYVYLLKGVKLDYMRFNTGSGIWELLSSAPASSRPKWDRGSWLVYDGQDKIYAHKAKVHELFAYYVSADSWGEQLTAMPFVRFSPGKSKKSKDGGSAAWYENKIYSLKGGNTVEFWRYHVDGDSWQGLDSMPSFGSTAKKRRVKEGADMVSVGRGMFFALKGKNTRELWCYQDGELFGDAVRPRHDGVVGAAVLPARHALVGIAPNPVVGGHARLFYDLPRAAVAQVTVHDVTGRIMQKYQFTARRNGVCELDVTGLAAGVYPVRLEAGGAAATVKLILK
jgi:hypothetical protein